jgi:hypothetical protein
MATTGGEAKIKIIYLKSGAPVVDLSEVMRAASADRRR